MGNMIWTLDLVGERHTVTLEHGYWSGKRVIRVDGVEVARDQKLFDTGGEYRFPVGRHQATIVARTSGLKFKHDLFVQERAGVGSPIPGRAWDVQGNPADSALAKARDEHRRQTQAVPVAVMVAVTLPLTRILINSRSDLGLVESVLLAGVIGGLVGGGVAGAFALGRRLLGRE
jgi:hypothetical protein